ncbi:MAG: PorT family protein [Saprospiraceae bacterium]|nr:PorT family protein [Saprospiraceae bacterium]
MKKLSLFLFAVIFSLGISQAQVRLGLKGGVSTYDLGVNELISVVDGSDAFELGISDAKFGFHLGAVVQFQIGSFVIQPEAVFNSNSVEYSLRDGNNPSVTELFSEKYQYVDIPLMFGIKAGPLRLMAGPVGHYFVDSSSDLFDFESYDQKFKSMTYGYQGGIGLDFFNVMLDVRYEGNFSKFGDHIVFGGTAYSFDSSPARLLASIAITIG